MNTLFESARTKYADTPAFEEGKGSEHTTVESIVRTGETDHIFIKYKDFYRKIMFCDIISVEADGSYSTIYLSNAPDLYVSFSIAELTPRLPERIFVRVHRSHLININRIDRFIGNIVYADGRAIPVSKSCRTALFGRLNILGTTRS